MSVSIIEKFCDMRAWFHDKWYRLKCFAWHRYTTVKPRTLPYHTFCDRCHLMPHMMFEIFTQFVEQELLADRECGSERKTEHEVVGPDGESVNLRDEIDYLYDWWHITYLIQFPKRLTEISEEGNKLLGDSIEWDDFWEDLGDGLTQYSPEKVLEPEVYQAYLESGRKYCKVEGEQYEELIKHLHRLIEIMPHLWT